MSCAYKTGSPPPIIQTPTPVWLDWLAFIKLCLAIIDIFQEATELRCAAYRKCPFNDE
jgi:hypothetical protein